MATSKTTVCITGASSGIGAALAQAYANNNTHLLLISRNTERLQAVATLCQQQGASVVTQSIDVTDRTTMTTWLQQQDALTPIDILIANAGCSTTQLKEQYNSLHDIESALWAIHLQGTLNTIHPILSCMQQRQSGHIVLMSSINAFVATASSTSYGAAKAALLHYGRSLRGKLLKDRIAVSVICPGWVDSQLTKKNTFKMPFKMPAERAAAIMQHGIQKKKIVIAFPWPLRLITRCIALLPERLKAYITQRT